MLKFGKLTRSQLVKTHHHQQSAWTPRSLQVRQSHFHNATMLVSSTRLFATTFKPEKPQVISSSQLQKTTATLVKEDESIERAQFEEDKVHDAASMTPSEPESKVATTSELRK